MPATTNNSTTPANLWQATVPVVTPGTPVQLITTGNFLANTSPASTLVEAVEIVPSRSRSSPNVGNIYIGFTSGATTQIRTLKPTDAPYVITAPPGKKIDLTTIWIDADTATDGVIWNAVN